MQREDPDTEVISCLAECGAGTYPVESIFTDAQNITKCETCNAACKTCDSDRSMKINNAEYGHPDNCDLNDPNVDPCDPVPMCTIGSGSADEGRLTLK